MTEKIKNILGSDLEPCCFDPMTGFFRDGYCNTNSIDVGKHLVCAVMTDEFLHFSQSQGNDLITPRDEFQFPGLKAKDQWCVCALQWKNAYDCKVAPPIKALSTHEKVLELIPLSILQKYVIQ